MTKTDTDTTPAVEPLDEQAKTDIQSLRFEIQEAWRTEDADVANRVMLDIIAALRTGKLTADLEKMRLSMASSYTGAGLVLTDPKGNAVRVWFERQIERPNAEDTAAEAYATGRRPVRDRKW